MPIDEYFKGNGIVQKLVMEASPRHKLVLAITDETEYFNEYFKTGLDVFMECVDHDLNMELFGLVLAEARNYSDLFEPCCQSGIFGCYIALETGCSYKGVDINPFGIEKAKQRAVKTGLDPLIFELGDVLTYTTEHEAIIGRYIVNAKFHDVDDEMVDALSRISRTIVLIQPSQAHSNRQTIEAYRMAFERHGYVFELLSEPKESPATGAHVFVVKATK